MRGVEGNSSRLFKTKASSRRAPRGSQVMLDGSLPAPADCYSFKKKRLRRDWKLGEILHFSSSWWWEPSEITSVGRLRQTGWEYKRPHTSTLLTCGVVQGLCVQRDRSDYFPSDGEQAGGSTVLTYGPEPIDSCWLDFDAPSVFGRLLSHFPLRPASTNPRACLLNPNAS